jgi:transcriptional regulator
MYIPDQFREDRPEVLRAFVAKHPLGALVTVTPEGLTANHLPMLWHEREGTDGALSGHMARANPVWKAIAPESPVLVIFGGANRYISPSWYPSKKEHGKVVPTWNYAVVHVHGVIRFIENDEHSLQHLAQLTDHQEVSRPEPWKVSDAPASFVQTLATRVVSFEISVTRVVGKFKAHQHRPESERDAVALALSDDGVPAADIVELVRAPHR